MTERDFWNVNNTLGVGFPPKLTNDQLRDMATWEYYNLLTADPDLLDCMQDGAYFPLDKLLANCKRIMEESNAANQIG